MTPLEAAAYWFVRHDAQSMSAEDRLEFEGWLAASEGNRRAYEQTGGTWQDFEQATDEAELRALRVAALAASPAPKVWTRAAAIAASVLVGVIGVATLTWRLSTDGSITEPDAPRATAGRYVTAHNQRSTVALPDGTLVSMNLDTVFRADFTADQRLIRLLKGQAFFEVAKDLQRPFVVAAADRHIRALGTKFDVRLDSNRVEVVLLEGRVSVDRSAPSLLDTLARRSGRVELEPNQRLVAARGEAASITSTNAMQATSWREGWIVFEDETLEHAIAELNRYSDRPIVAAEEAVRRMRLSGVFRIGQPDRFGAIIQELLPLTAQRGERGETVLVSKAGGGAQRP